MGVHGGEQGEEDPVLGDGDVKLGGFFDRIRFIREKNRAEFNKKVSHEVLKRCQDPAPVTVEEYRSFRGNSYDRKLMHKKLDDHAFLELTEYCFSQSTVKELGEFEVATTYDDAIARELFPSLLRRFKALLERQDG